MSGRLSPVKRRLGLSAAASYQLSLLMLSLGETMTEVVRLSISVCYFLDKERTRKERYFPCEDGLPLVLPDAGEDIAQVEQSIELYISKEVDAALSELTRTGSFASDDAALDWCIRAFSVIQSANDRSGRIQLVSATAATLFFSLDKAEF